jgi:hypothetical protein
VCPLPPGHLEAFRNQSALFGKEDCAMMGKVTHLANQYGSKWGRIRPANMPREVFFDAASMAQQGDFDRLLIGDEVHCEEEVDSANGMRAIDVGLTASVLDF